MSTILCKTLDDVRPALETVQAVHTSFDMGMALSPPWVTYNGLSFDCPQLETAARFAGVKPFFFDFRKYGSSRNVVDLYGELDFWGSGGTAVLSRSLKAMASRFGLPVTDDTDGSEVAALVEKGNWDAIAAHCESDVQLTAALFQRLHPARAGVIVDLETVALDNAADYRAFVKPDARLTDPAKITASIDAKLEKAALDPYLSRIVCLGYQVVTP